MSEFQLGLLGIGIAVVIAVLGFNKWQEIRFRRQSENSLKADHADILLDANAPAKTHAAEEDQEKEWADFPPARLRADVTPVAGAAGLGLKNQSDPSSLSKTIHLVALLEAPAGVSTNDFGTTGLSGTVASRMHLEAWSEGKWIQPLDDVPYTHWNAGLQLVNRQGPVSEQDLASYVAWIGEISIRSGATVSPIDIDAALHEAISLDKFCGEVDIQIAVHIVAGNAPFPGTRIRAIAEAAGLVMEADGKFRRRDEDGRELFRLANEGESAFNAELMRELASPSVILEFDVARSPGGNHAFSRFRQFAEHLASGLGGRVVDDNRAPLQGAGFDAIAKELAAVYQAMAARGISPGSPESLRLFS